MEIFNEYTIVIIFNICFTFTDFNPDPHMKHYMGWVTIFLLCFNLAISLFILFKDFLRLLYLYNKKYMCFGLAYIYITHGINIVLDMLLRRTNIDSTEFMWETPIQIPVIHNPTERANTELIMPTQPTSSSKGVSDKLSD